MPEEEQHRHRITVDINNTGFSSDDLQELRPEFEDPAGERPMRYVWQWAPSSEGPDSFRLIVAIYAAAGVVGGAWLKALADDMYKWAKSNLGRVFTRRRRGDGWTKIQFEDKTFYIDYHPSSDEFADAWLELPQRIGEIKSSDHKNLVLKIDDSGSWTLEGEGYER
jgi:hypothetical protein